MATSCPDQTLLRAHVRGELPGDEAAALDAHVEHCPICCKTLEDLLADEPLAHALAGVGKAVAQLPQGDEVKQLLDRLHAIGHPPGTVSTEVPATEVPGETRNHAGTLTADQTVPTQIGRYCVVAKLGAGGMGTVYKAFDPELGRDVAIKVPRWREARLELAQRFLREARLAAGIPHPHVCTIHDVGEQHGQPYVVMALIEGMTLAEHLKTHSLTAEQAVAWTRKIALGLEAIHKKGIIHRDLKPGNVLLDQAGEPVLTDFGLARPLEDVEHLTSSGAVIGTPAYMSIEQASGEGDRIGPLSDLYSLGVMLYQMITGRLPFEGPTVMSLLYKIRNETPPPPTRYVPQLDRGLEKIVLKAIAREPKDRYQSARELIEALDGWAGQTGNPEPAAKERGHEPGRRWIGIAAALLLAIGGVVAYQVVIQIRGPDGKKTELTVPDDSKVAIDPKGKITVTLPKNEKGPQDVLPGHSPLDALDPQQIPKSERFDWQPKELVAMLGKHDDRPWGEVKCLAYSPDGNHVISGGDDCFLRVWRADTMAMVDALKLTNADGTLWSLAFRPDGKTVAAAGRSGICYLCDFHEGRLKLAQELPSGTTFLRVLAWSPDGKLLAAACPFSSELRFWDMTGKNPVARQMPTESGLLTLAFSPDGKLLLAAGSDKTLRLWDVQGTNITPRATVTESTFGHLAISSDSTTLATFSEDTVSLWNIQAKEPKRFKQTKLGRDFNFLAFAARTNCLAICPMKAGQVGVWKVNGDQVTEERLLNEHYYTTAISVALAPDGKALVVGTDTGTLDAWNLATPSPALQRRQWTDNFIASSHDGRLGISSDGKFLACGDRTGVLHLFEAGEKALKLRRQFGIGFQEGDSYHELAFCPRGRWLAADANSLAALKLWRLNGDVGQKSVTLPFYFKAEADHVAVSGDGSVLAGASNFTSKIALWDTRGDTPRTRKGIDADGFIFGGVALSADGALLACFSQQDGSNARDVRIWDISKDEPRQLPSLKYPEINGWVTAIAFSPTGKLFALGGYRFTQIFDLSGGEPKPLVKLPGEIITRSIAFSPTGDRLLTADHSGALAILEMPSGKRLWQRVLPGPICKVAFAPDARHILTLNGNGTIYILRIAA